MELLFPYGVEGPAVDDAVWVEVGRLLLPLLVPAMYILYAATAHYQRPTRPLVYDSIGFASGLGLWISLALLAPWPWLRLALIVPVVAFLSVFFVGNKACYRFFKDWVHHQMLFEWRVGKPIFMDVGRTLQPWEWVGGIGLPAGATALVLMYGRPAPVGVVLPGGLLLIVLCAMAHAMTRSKYFATDEHNPFMNFARGWLKEFKGSNARRAAAIAPAIRPGPADGFRHAQGLEFPLVQEPLPGPAAAPRRLSLNGQLPNIVLIVLESVRALECGAYGAKISFTPQFDALARSGLVMRNFYANGSQTVRGELALLCSFYDQFGGSPLYMRQPSIRIRSLPEILRDHGYSTHWISSYTASYHNKEEFLLKHGVEQIHDDRGLPKGLPKINWGPPDEELYKYATDIFDRQHAASGGEKPFFAEIMTLTNHWPFPGPYPTSDRTPVVCDDKLYTNYTRGVYYTDYSLGRFFEAIRDKPWFENTIFAITSDHGAWIYPDALGLNGLQKQEAYFRMPMLYYAPSLLKPGVIDQVASQVDVAPTLLDMLGIRARHSFVGRSAFDAIEPSKRYALMLHWHSWNVRMGNEYLYTMGKSFLQHHNRCARPDDRPEKSGTTYAYFQETNDLLRKENLDSIRLQDGPEMAKMIGWGEDLLYLVEFLRLHKRIYDEPMRVQPSSRPAGIPAEPVPA